MLLSSDTPAGSKRPVLELLTDYDIALCFSDHRDAPTPWEVTASFVYVRGHGPGGILQRPLFRADAENLGQIFCRIAGAVLATSMFIFDTTTRRPPPRQMQNVS